MKIKALSLFIITTFISQASVANWQDLFRNKDQRAHEMLAHGKAAQAASTFEDPNWQGVAHYRSGHYDKATKLFQIAPSTENTYNLGNSYAFQGKFEQAIQAYKKVLQADPNHKDAQFNLKLVQKLKQKQQQQQQQAQNRKQSGRQNKSQQQSQNKNNPKQDPSNKNKNKQDQQQAQNDQNQDDSKKQNQKQNNQAQNSSDKQLKQQAKNKQPKKKTPKLSRAELEKMQSNKQWLKRIQEDPQDLLKRKFLRDYINRRKQGGLNENTRINSAPT